MKEMTAQAKVNHQQNICQNSKSSYPLQRVGVKIPFFFVNKIPLLGEALESCFGIWTEVFVPQVHQNKFCMDAIWVRFKNLGIFFCSSEPCI